MTIAPAALIAVNSVVIRTASEVVTPANGFFISSDPDPTLLSASPNRAAVGQSVTVTLSGFHTHFAQGSTQVSFGSGVTVEDVIITSATSLNVRLTVDPEAAMGPRTITATSGLEALVLPNAFSVVAGGPVPLLISVTPAAALQGEAHKIAVTGQDTHFDRFATQLDIGPGVAVNALTVTSSTTLVATIVVSPTAAHGTRRVTATTGAEVASRPNGFTVLFANSAPTLTLVAPNSGRQGQGGPVTIIGQNTNFVQGVTQVDMGPGIAVGAVTVACATCLTAEVTIAETASVGARTVTVTTGPEVVFLVDGFTVQPGIPILTSLSRASGEQGQSFPVTITGKFTHFAHGTTVVDLGAGINVSDVVVSSPSSLSARVMIDVSASPGARTLTVTTGDEVVFVSDVFTVIAAGNHAPVVDAGSNQTISLPAVALLAGSATDDGLPAGSTLAYSWTKVDGPGAVTFSNATSAVTTASFSEPGTYTIRLTVADSELSGADDVLVFVDPSGNQAPEVNAGPDHVVVLPASVTLHGSAIDDGLPEGSTLTFAWFQVTGPAPIAADDTTKPDLVASLTVPGTYVVRLVVDDGELAGSDDVVIVVNPSPNKAPVVNAGLDRAITLPAGTTLSGAVADDGLPEGASVTVLWTQVSGPGAVVFGDPTRAITSATFATAGTYVLRLTASDTVLSAFDDIVVLARPPNESPAANAGPDLALVLPAPLTISYSVTDDGRPLGGALTIEWTMVSGPGTALFRNQTLTTITVGFDVPGTYVLRVTATDTEFTVTDDVAVVVTGTAAPPPTLAITSPVDGAEITTFTNVLGTVSSAALVSWTLEMRMADEPEFRPFATGTTAVTDGLLGVFDPTLLLNGAAQIRLSALDTSGHSFTTPTVGVVLTKNQKIGNFTVAFNDLTVPVAGFPIQVVRTYDSRHKRSGEFGFGWTLDLKTVRLEENRKPGQDWVGTRSDDIIPTFCIRETIPHIVAVTLTDGTVYQFKQVVSPQCQLVAPIEEVTVTFEPLPGTTASLAAVGGNVAFVDGTYPGPLDLFDLGSAVAFDPDVYMLTLPDGRTLRINQATGLEVMADLNGNTLTITPAGITHSSGKGVDFIRDASGRIIQVTDPAGNGMTYGYDAAGDLTTFRDREDQITTFGYNASHGLLTINDPRGIQPIRNEYDDAGRLIKHIDAFGNEITYTHDLSTRQEIVEDRLGHITVNEYDDHGNVVTVTDPLGGVTQRTYDARGNLLTETNAVGQQRTYTYDGRDNRLTDTDPLGNTTTYTYNARSQVLTITDPLDRVTTNEYDEAGNLIRAVDPAGRETTYTYNAAGLQTSVTDPLGHVARSEYDGFGNLTKQNDALGNATTYTYDPNGNRLTETRTRTTTAGLEMLITRFEYDQLGRLVKTTFPDGSTTQTIYNAIGKQGVTIDQLGRVTSYSYDAMGRLTRATFPDGSRESSTYDAEGRRVTSVDRAGRATVYTYDALGRLTKTTFADGSSTSSAYDAIGQVTQVTDARRNSTKYEYDAAGRRTRVTDPLGLSTTFAYDEAGNQASMTDANGHTTQFTYDAVNRRTKVAFADGTSEETEYDALGRTVAKRDQAGVVTEYQYDALGHLTAVVDALSQVTSYEYDEVGNRISQTDANGHMTRFVYDVLSRRTRRILPLGMQEFLTYDAAGNLAAKMDFNGHTTTYTYDAVNRLTSKIPFAPRGEPTVTFGYTITGQRAQMIDASGTTTYAYDDRDRLIQKITPQGTLTYTYDAAGNLASIRSSNAGGTSVSYAYDALNRLSTVTDNRLTEGVTTYDYDDVGNLASYTYPNGVTHSHMYDEVNRLVNLSVTNTGGPLASYSYTLGPPGNRTRVVELGGRTVDYTYDDLYRLTSETIAGGTSNGTIRYRYDPVGNRLERTSTVGPVPPTGHVYDANDRLVTETYDANGNTIASGGRNYSYDFENRIQKVDGDTIGILYDGDGNRVAKTVRGLTTRYLVDDRNLTGYAQILEELITGSVDRTYTYGLDLISSSRAFGTRFYGYDGHGNVRLLVDARSTITDRYDYDAFGVQIHKSEATSNNYLYTGEQSDPDLSLYYLRARYMNTEMGRFWTSDPVEGDSFEPATLHRFIYARNSPLNFTDPSGLFTLTDVILTISIVSDLRIAQASALVRAFQRTKRAANDVLRPARLMQDIALRLLADGVPGAFDLYVQGQRLESSGYREIDAVLEDVYKDIAKSLLTLKLKVNSRVLLTVSADGLATFVDKYGKWLIVAADYLRHPTDQTRGNVFQALGDEVRRRLIIPPSVQGELGWYLDLAD